VYVAGISGMFAAAFLSRRFSRKTALLQDVLPDSQMYRASIGCMIFGAFGWIAIASLGESAHLLQTGFNQLNQLMPLGIIIGVMYEIRSSGGKRSISLPVLIGAIYFFCFFGLVGFSKQGLLEPIVCWLLPVCALRFRLSTIQIAGCLVGVFIIFQYLVPYAQYGRRFLEPEQSLSERIALSYGLLEQIGDVREKYRQEEAEVPTGSGEYFNTAQGFWDRLQFISVDDPLINITDQGRVLGFAPISESFINAVPHFIWPDKPPPIHGGNFYAHEIAGLDTYEGDTTTGVSFSPTAEAYHMAKWVGILVAAPLLWLFVFTVYDSLFGDLRATPWGLLVIAQLSHTAPEGAITGLIAFGTTGILIFVFCALFAKWVAPHFAVAVLGPERRNDASRFSFQPAGAPVDVRDDRA
jgi:hypothetical protein